MYSTGMQDLVVERLADHLGNYLIFLKCACGHIRRCSPNTLAAFAGWDARLADVVKRMRCTKCRQRRCTASTVKGPNKGRYSGDDTG